MPEVPAICDACGLVFGSGMVFENARNITLSGNRAQCPRCGAWGRIPDGVYNAFDRTLELVTGPARTVADLKALQSALLSMRARQAKTEDIAAEIKRVAPELETSLLPQTRSELYAFLALIIAALTLILGQCEGGQSIQDVDVTQIYNTTIEHVLKAEGTGPQEATVKKVGRNQPCPCGSGQKYKKCHGAAGGVQ